MSIEQSSAGKKRKCIVYDMPTNTSGGEEEYDKVDVREKTKTQPTVSCCLMVFFCCQMKFVVVV